MCGYNHKGWTEMFSPLLLTFTVSSAIILKVLNQKVLKKTTMKRLNLLPGLTALVFAALFLVGCTGNDTTIDKNSWLLSIRDGYLTTTKIEQDSIDHPVPKPTSVAEFMQNSQRAARANDSCVETVKCIDRKFRTSIVSGKIKSKDIVDIISSAMTLKLRLAMYVHRSKLNRSFDGATTCSYLGPKGAMKLYIESDTLVQKGFQVLEDFDSPACDNFIDQWNIFKHSWNTINEYDTENQFDETYLSLMQVTDKN